MTSALATIAPKLRKLVLMLSSSHDGEVIGAARAIGRALADAGTDWHQFAEAVTRAHHSNDWQAMAQFCLRASLISSTTF